jgi:hypothetical protein
MQTQQKQFAKMGTICHYNKGVGFANHAKQKRHNDTEKGTQNDHHQP